MPSPKNIDYTNKDYESFKNLMISLIPTKTPEWTDTRESDFGIVLIELLAYCLDILSYYQDRNANEAFLSTAKLRRSVINLVKLIGYTPKGYFPAEFDAVFTLSEVPTNDIIIPQGFQVGTERTETEESIVFEVKDTFTIPAGTQEAVIRIVQGETINNEIIGSSNGSDRQRFKLKNKPVVVDDTLKVYVRQGGLWLKWDRVDDFIDSGKLDNHYKVDVDEDDNVFIEFGNGVAGRVPPEGINNIMATYRICNGSSGNVGVNTITKIISEGVPLLKSVNNPNEAVIEGIDKESIEDVKFYAPRSFRTLDRAVTDLDFKDLVMNYALPSGKRPVKSCEIEEGIPYRIYIIFHDDIINQEELLQEISDFLDPKRLLLDQVALYLGTEVSVDITMDVITYQNYRNDTVKIWVEEAIRDYFNKMELKQPVYVDDLISVVKAVEGVRSCGIVAPTENITLNINEIAVEGTTTITVTGGV